MNSEQQSLSNSSPPIVVNTTQPPKKKKKKKKRSLIKKLMKQIKKPHSDEDIKRLHQERIAHHLGGGQFKKMTKIH